MTNNVWRLFWALVHEWLCVSFIQFYIIHTILTSRKNSDKQKDRRVMSDFNEDSFIDGDNVSADTLERLRNITMMFNGKEDGQQELKKVEKIVPSEKIQRTFRKFEEVGSSIDQIDEDDEEYLPSNGIIQSTRKKKTPKEHIPYHEMAEVKDKFEKGLIDNNKVRTEKRLDVRVQSGLTSSKKQAFEQGEFEQAIEQHVSKIDIEKGLIEGLTSAKKQAFERRQSMDYDSTIANKIILVERDALAGVATEKKAKFENGSLSDHPRMSLCADEIAAFVGTGLAQAKRSELLSKMDAEQQIQRAADRSIDMDTEQGIAIARREQLASLANSGFKSTEKYIDVAAGLTNTIKEQYIADASKTITTKTTVPTEDIESGLTKNRATVFKKFDETTVKRTVDIDNELLERGVAKERVAMFKNLESGSQALTPILTSDSKIRVDGFRWHVPMCQPMNSSTLKRKHPSIENGNVVRESDKREEIYFGKGQTKQLVEQWKTKQISPDRDSSDVQIVDDTEVVQQGKAKNLVQMWKSIDKENTPPPERRGLRAFTPPTDSERRVIPQEDEDMNVQKTNDIDDTASIELGHAKAVREKFLQNAEQNGTINKRKALKQFTPPPDSPNVNRRKSLTPPDTNGKATGYEDEVVSIKGQAKSLKNRFIELEQDAMKVETASSKIKYVPKRFVNTPAPKQNATDSITDPSKCSACSKTVYAMEKIEADKKVYHKSCFKCTHCKSILKLGNFTANDGQIYCKPHFLQLFAIKGNYSAGFGLDDHKMRWLQSTSFNEN